MKNPWSEDSSAVPAKKVRAQIELSRRTLQLKSTAGMPLKAEISEFVDDLDAINKALASHPDAWRSHRSFLVVELPAVVEAVCTLAECADHAQGREELEALLSRTLTRSAAVRRDCQSRDVNESILALSVLDRPETVTDVSDTVTSRFFGGVTGAIKTTGGAITSRTGKAMNEVRHRGGSLYDLAGAHAGQAYRGAKTTLFRPITVRITALTDSLLSTGGSALVWGAIGTLIFPPLAPFLVGETLLSLPEAYTRQLAALSDKDARELLEQKGRDKIEVDQIMAALKGGAMRFETPCLSVKVDTREGTASGIILRGAFIGESLENMETAKIRLLRDKSPDDETRQALSTWLARIEGAA